MEKYEHVYSSLDDTVRLAIWSFFFFFFLGGWWMCCPAASQVKFKMHPSVILAGGCHEYSASFYPQVMLLWCHSDTEQTVISNV